MNALLDTFSRAFDALPVRDAAGLGAARRSALDAALRDGLPPARTECWKYTPLRALERRAFAPVDAGTPALDRAVLAAIPAPRIVFVNGRFDAATSDLTELPDGVSLQPLSQLLHAGDARDASFLARRFERGDEVFARLNAALADDGVVLRVAADVHVRRPIQLAFVGTADTGDRGWHLRHLIELAAGAELHIVEHQLAGATHTHFANALMHVQLGPHARLSHARVQAEANGATLITRTDAVLAEAADYRRLDLELGAALSRHELNVALQGDAARVHANGVLLGTGRRHLDTRLGIEHIARDTVCDLRWRGLADDRAHAVFHGGITIAAGADGSDAQLSNKNLLLSAAAEIDTQPVLVIHADEVKATHGATVGQLDDTALFYLRSRGIPAADARRLLITAFCREPLAVLDDAALVEQLRGIVDARLAGIGGAQ